MDKGVRPARRRIRVAVGRAFGEVIATSENMLPRGVEHDFALNSLGGGGGWSKDEQPEVV